MQNLKSYARAVAGVVLLLAIALTLVQRSTNAAEKRSVAPARGYYLTQGTYDGSQALNACTVGYHMASLWEIHEPSYLRYETTLALTSDDSGFGPPTNCPGWIRTGQSAHASGTDPWASRH